MRLIDADALIKQIEDFNCKDCNNYNFVRCRACHIDDAVTYIDEAPTVDEWISVKKKLPDKPEGYPKCELRKCYFLVAYRSGGILVTSFDFEKMEWAVNGSYITHWMPLPEPPEGVKQDG